MSCYAPWSIVTRSALRIRRSTLLNRAQCEARPTLALVSVRHASSSHGSGSGSSSSSMKTSGPSTGVVEKTLNPETDALQRAHATLIELSRLRYTGTRSDELERLAAASESLLQPENSVMEAGEETVSIAVYGPSNSPSACNLVTALLDDPLSSDEMLRSSIRNRWTGMGNENARDLQRFIYSKAYSSSDGVTSLPSPFFTRFDSPVTLHELPTSSSTTSQSQVPTAFAHFLAADVPILVLTPLLAPLSPATRIYLRTLPRNPHALFVINLALNPASPSVPLIKERVAEELGYEPSRVLFVDIDRALRGIDALRSDPGSALAVRQYQEDILGSQLPSLLHILERTVQLGPGRLHDDARRALAQSLVLAERGALREVTEEVGRVRTDVSKVRSFTLEWREQAVTEILGGEEGVEKGEKGAVAKGLEKVARDVRPTLDSLKWWRLPFVVDDVSARVDRVVEQGYAKEFENVLVFRAGRLSIIQARLVSLVNTLLSNFPPSFRSPVLHNSLAQLASAPSFALTPASTLLAPLHARTAQLAHATRALHLSAQRLLLSSFLASALSTTGGYALWLAQLLDAPSAAGGAALGALIGLRWAVGRWEHARRAWWADFDRVGAGLARDLRKALEGVLDKQVCAVPEEACRGLDSIVERREGEMGKLEEVLAELEELPSGKTASQAQNEV